MMVPIAMLAALALLGPVAGTARAAAADTLPISIRLDTGEADAALAILARRAIGDSARAEDWARLFESEGYRRLREREASMGRPFEEAAMRAFLEADSMAARSGALAETVARWRGVDVTDAARRAFAYLPAGATIRATVYLVIKPRTNSFVYDLRGDPAIFLYVDPSIPPERLANTIAHELHHVGFARACDGAADTTLSEAQRAVRDWTGAFGEGVAVLAAAGGPREPPDTTWTAADRIEWRRDLADLAPAMAQLEDFFIAIARGAPDESDSIMARGMAFFGNRGPWYTVGYAMARAIERAFGRERLVASLCDMRDLVRAYQAAVRLAPRGSRWLAALPQWSDRLMDALGGTSHPRD
jgi:hypothetical protein